MEQICALKKITCKASYYFKLVAKHGLGYGGRLDRPDSVVYIVSKDQILAYDIKLL